MSEYFVSVKIEGQEVRDIVHAIDVEETDSQACLAVLRFGDSDLVLGDVLQEGLSVEIDLGSLDSHAVVFRGPITGLSVQFPGSDAARVEVQALDNLALLGYRPRTKRWWNTTIQQIVTEIAAQYALRPGEITVGGDTPVDDLRPLQQVEETDLGFLQRLARDRACRLFVDHPIGPDTLNLVSVQSLLAAPPLPMTLRFNDNVRDFTAGVETFATDPAEAVVTTDPATGEPVTIEESLATAADATWVPDSARLARLGEGAAGVTALAASAAAKRATLSEFWRVPARRVGAASRSAGDRSGAAGDRARRLGQIGRGRTGGNMLLRPRKRVTLEGFGGRWSGAWYLAKVCHQVDLQARRYTNSFVVTR